MLVSEGPSTGGYATVLSQEAKTARGAPYVASEGTAVLCWGINDLGNRGNTTQLRTAFIHALRAAISRHRAASVREHTDSTVSVSGGAVATTGGAYSSGDSVRYWTTAGGSFTITLPADFPGGTIAIGLVGAAGPYGGTITWGGNASAGTTGTTSTSAVMPAGLTHGHLVRRVAGLDVSDAGKTIIGTITGVDSGGVVALDYWQIEATTPPLTVVCTIPRLRDSGAYGGYSAGVGDADVAAWNAAITTLVGEFTTGVALADIDAAIGKNPSRYAVDGVHPNELGARAIADTVIDAAAAAGRAGPVYQLLVTNEPAVPTAPVFTLPATAAWTSMAIDVATSVQPTSSGTGTSGTSTALDRAYT
ncbi:hypothetical protein, partial [Frankia sp. CIT1]|uniref:SGNH/GDSL hydrolase family protein n=1 Tax=Frankia sp. CIT1 TaxID=2880974 RepID=UPI001EF623C5